MIEQILIYSMDGQMDVDGWMDAQSGKDGFSLVQDTHLGKDVGKFQGASSQGRLWGLSIDLF